MASIIATMSLNFLERFDVGSWGAFGEVPGGVDAAWPGEGAAAGLPDGEVDWGSIVLFECFQFSGCLLRERCKFFDHCVGVIQTSIFLRRAVVDNLNGKAALAEDNGVLVG